MVELHTVETLMDNRNDVGQGCALERVRVDGGWLYIYTVMPNHSHHAIAGAMQLVPDSTNTRDQTIREEVYA